MTMNLLRRLCADRAGNVGVFLALSAVPIIACAGAAMDYVYANQQRTELQARLDTAVLAAVSGSTSGKTQGQRRTAANKLFKENCNKNDCEAKLKLTFDGSKVRGTAAFDMPTAFMRVVGINTMPITAVAEAATDSSTYMDIYLALDISDSMGLAASTADQQRLDSATGCVFACHVNDDGTNGPGVDTDLEKAQSMGITLRLDTLKSASTTLVNDLLSSSVGPNLRFAVYPFHHRAYEALSPSNKRSDVINAITALKIGEGLNRLQPAGQPGDTISTSLFDLLNSKIKTQGSGSKGDPQKILLLVTDGTETIRYYGGSATTKLFDAKLCNELKAKGVSIAVVEIIYNYWNKENNRSYSSLVAPIEKEIEPNLRSCSSDGLFARGDQPAEIEAAFKAIGAKISSGSPRLTQ